MPMAVVDVGEMRMEMAHRLMRVEMLVRAVAIPGEVVPVAVMLVMDMLTGLPGSVIAGAAHTPTEVSQCARRQR